MATGAVNDSPQQTRNALASTGRTLFCALAWGAFMLFVFGFWMRSKHEGGQRIITNIFLVSGAVTAALAFWQAFTLWLKNETPEQKSATLSQQQSMLSYALLGGGIGLIVLAIFLGVEKSATGGYGFSLDNFAESFGVLLMGLISLVSGYFLQQPGSQGITMDFLVGKVPVLKFSQLVIMAAAIGLMVVIYVKHRTGNGYTLYLPELAVLLCLSVLALGCFLYLNTGNMDEAGLRLFVLIFGGTAGLLMFLWAVWRTIVWRDDILLGGISAWQGDRAYRFWLCAYVVFFALALMFFSFNLARADVRKVAWLRLVMYGYDTVVQTLLLVGILFIFNVVVYAVAPFTFDWTKTRGAYSLAESSKNLITSLKQDVNIVVLIPQNTYIHKDVRVLLDNCQALSNHVKVEYVSPDLDDERYEKLIELFPRIMPESPVPSERRGVLIAFGPMPKPGDKHSTPHSFISEKKLHEVDQMAGARGEKAKSIFKGETEILKEIKFLSQGKKQQKIYILQNEDLCEIGNMDGTERFDIRLDFSKVGVGFLADQLKKDNYDVLGLNFGIELPGQNAPGIVFVKAEGPDKRKEVPSDCHALIIAGVTRDLPKETLDALDRYMDRAGKVLVFFDLAADTNFAKLRTSNLEDFVKRFGVELTDDVALRLGPGDPRTLWATTPGKTENPLGKGFAKQRINMRRGARVLKKAEGPGRFKAEVVLEQDLRRDRLSIVQKNVAEFQDYQKFIRSVAEDEKKFLTLWSQKPLPLAVAVSEGEKPRMVVFGDTDFITNREIVESQTRTTNYGFVVSALEWMAEREGIGAQPKVSTNFSLSPEVNVLRMILMPGWLMLLALVTVGVCIWVVRRR